MSRLTELQLPIRAAIDTAAAHGVATERCDILQDGHTLVLRLSESLVARVVTDRDGPRQGGEWFARESAVACHLARHGAPVIPMHPDLPPGPHEQLGYTLNFWQFVTAIDAEAAPRQIGATLHHCHKVLQSYQEPLPEFGILFETLELLETPAPRTMLSASDIALLRDRLSTSLAALRAFPMQALHGDAHGGNLMNTTRGLLWTDWEDTFLGPVEWDLASIIWNARILEEDHATADAILAAYRRAGGTIDEAALHQSLIARAAVMSAWYPVLYPELTAERKAKLRLRLEWLEAVKA
jgi:hypothetical protein